MKEQGPDTAAVVHFQGHSLRLMIQARLLNYAQGAVDLLRPVPTPVRVAQTNQGQGGSDGSTAAMNTSGDRWEAPA